MATVRLVSALPRTECVRRLTEKVRPWWGGAVDAPRGRVGEHSATLRMPIWYRNSFQTVLRMTLSDNDRGGTDLTCKFGISRIVLGFMALWFTLIAGIDIVSAFFALLNGEHVSIGALIFPFGMGLFGAAIVGIGRYAARNQQTELLLFLEETLDARLDSPNGAGGTGGS